uniref:Uncharacterized protein n=1 Tax=Anas platyrhynchos TaxID=8839 RepID=A0A8B9R6W4_ANAPL
MRSEPFSPIQNCPQRKAWGTRELPRGAFTQPHMQLDPPGSLFLSKPKRIPSCHRRRVKNQAPGNPHMQLDPPGSLFPSIPKHSPSWHRRRLINQAPGNVCRDPFSHVNVPPKERFGYI